MWASTKNNILAAVSKPFQFIRANYINRYGTMKERIIRLLGGCTSEEAIESNGNSASIGMLMALYDVQDYMRQNNGESPDVWCKNVWQYVCDEIDKLTNKK